MLSGNNVMVTGGTWNQNIHGRDSSDSVGFERLLQATSPSAFHNSGDRFDPPKCHPKTRLKVLEKIMNWIDGVEHQNESVMWVNGGAGVGKSAIAQTLAERLDEEKRLVASFFFSRSDPSRNDVNRLVPTIAYHMMLHIPHLKEPIVRAVAQNPLIFKLSVGAQFSVLLREPIRNLAESGFFQSISAPRLVIVDGLDECNDPKAQVSILQAISNTLRTAHFPLRFLIASRPESHLSLAFSSKPVSGVVVRLTLDNTFLPEHDIRFFLEDKFEELRDSHPLRAHLPPLWPSPANIHELVWKSSGQFIYPSTVIKYISSHRHRPNHRLDVILGLRPPRNEHPFAELDMLYSHILSSLEIEDIARVLDILAVHLIFQNTIYGWSIADIELFLSLEAGDVEIALCDLASVVCIEEDKENTGEPYIKVLHASFSDFLVDQSRSGVFFIETPLRCTILAERYLEILKMTGTFKLPSNCWYWNIPYILSKTTLNLQFHFSDFSLLNISTNWYDKKRYKNKLNFAMFMISMERMEDTYDQLQKTFDEYLMAYLGNYYWDASHVFIVALAGIGASYTHNLCKRDPNSDWEIHRDVEKFFQASISFDRTNLALIWCLSNAHRYLTYNRNMRRFLNDSSRSGALALNEERYAIAALHCLKILCSEKSPIPRRDRNLREQKMRTHRPWIWRRVLGPNARDLRRCMRKLWKKTNCRLGIFQKYPKFLNGMDDYCHSRVFCWVLQCFCRLMKQAGSSKELLDFASRCSFSSRCQDWPRKTKLARGAVNRYIDFFGSYNRVNY